VKRGKQVGGKLHLYIVLAMAAFLLGACSEPAATPPAPVLLRLAGSTSMQPLLRELSMAYSARYKHVTFDLVPVGSSAGLELLRRGHADLALVSRELEAGEEYESQTGKRLLSYAAIARDGIAVVVNAQNPLRGLSLYQVRNVFEGQVTDWSEVGGSPGEIVIISREDGSGTRAVFEELVMYGRRVSSTALVLPGSEAVCECVAGHEGAVGYLSLGHIGPGVAVLAIDDVRPEQKTVQESTYGIVRPFLLVSQAEPTPEVLAFMQFCRSPTAEAIVTRNYAPGR